ncbi:uncharacterized protein LY89DRAFT_663834 [Mollisia scopiformis]|uniref:RGS domain-containing protein n=1 Tax=Mollisia scopiformis TaxID=149040 RepID=A0A194XT56_MOLSC|nr:uncharacterized protein LY89DRAFT_663834 [Mollisia scopiformis]KUJ23388.1 hypothetical protein LY89DRAFT_663834 [Mollisia scopiformis]
MTSMPSTEPSFCRTVVSVALFRRPETFVSHENLQDIMNHAKSNSRLTSKTISEVICFEKMMAGSTLPPLTKVDFMAHLVTANDSEHLEFSVCFEYYKKLFEAVDDKSAFSTPFSAQDENNAKKYVAAAARAKSGGTTMGFEDSSIPTPVIQAFQRDESYSPRTTVERLREEVDYIKKTFIVQGGKQELNLDSRTRDVLLYALGRSIHPSAFRLAVDYANEVLRKHYTEFVKVSNPVTNKTKLVGAHVIGVSLVLAGLCWGILFALSKHNRAWRALGFLPVALGAALLFAAVCRLSVVLYPLGHYHLKPWSIQANNETRLSRIHPDNFPPASGDINWPSQYNRRFLVRKWFDKDGPIQDARLRYGEVVLVGQALWFGILCGVVVLVVLLPIPPRI